MDQMLGNYDLASFNKVLSNFDLFWEVFACCWHAAILFKMLVIPWIVMFLLLEVPHTPPKRNTFSFGLYNWNGDIEFVPKNEYEQLHSRSACSTGIPIGACFLFVVCCPNRCLPCYMWAASWSPLYNISLPRSERHLCNATATAGIRHICPL